MNTNRIAVIGDGGWGTTLSILLSGKGYDITLWSAFKKDAENVKRDRENKKYLPGIKLPETITVTSDVNSLSGHDIYIIAVPCQYLRDILKGLKGKIGSALISVAKGIENNSLKRPSEIIKEVLGGSRIAVLSGPTIAYEVVRNMPSAAVIASGESKLGGDLQNIFSTKTFRIYNSADVVGVELAGALKNVIAIAAGISDGMGFGINTKAAILTRGLAEIARLGVKLGAKKETFSGLSGVGDLATTCMSSRSRNRWLGEEIGKGKNLKEILSGTSMVVEGVATAKSAHELAKKSNVEMPITEQIYQVLYEDKNPRLVVSELMTRELKRE